MKRKRHKKAVWGWADSDTAEFWHGREATREEAIAAGRSGTEEGQAVWVVRGETLDVAEHVKVEVEKMVEDIDMHAAETVLAEDVIFDIRPDMRAEAQLSLDSILQDWARRYVSNSGYWRAVGDPELIDPGEDDV